MSMMPKKRRVVRRGFRAVTSINVAPKCSQAEKMRVTMCTLKFARFLIPESIAKGSSGKSFEH